MIIDKPKRNFKTPYNRGKRSFNNRSFNNNNNNNNNNFQRNAKRKVKLLHENSIKPTKSNKEDAAWDLYLIEDVTIPALTLKKVDLGIAMEIRRGQMGSVRCRSSTKDNGLFTPVTTLDAGYTGPLSGFIYNSNKEDKFYKKGERIFQIAFVKIPYEQELEEGEIPEISSRGAKGFGSSGK